MMRRLFPIAALVSLAVAGSAAGQNSPLTVEKIMQDPDTWIGAQPSGLEWSETGDRLWFRWNPGGDFMSDSLYHVAADGGEPTRATRTERLSPRPTFDGWHHGEGVYDAAFRRKVFADGGDIHIVDRRSGDITSLTNTLAWESNPRFTADGSGLIYYRDGQAFRLDLESAALTQLTDLRSGEEPSEEPSEKSSEQEAWLEADQLRLFDVLRERAERREAAEAARERDREASDDPETYWSGKGSLEGLQVDPAERFASFIIAEREDNAETAGLNYVTESGYAEQMESRPKVGETPDRQRLFVLDLSSGEAVKVDPEQLPGIHDVQPVHLVEEGVEVDSSEARAVRYGPVLWSPDGAFAVVQIASLDWKDRWMVRIDPATADVTVLHREHQDSWVSAPAGSWWGFGEIGWLPDAAQPNRSIWFRSEETGYAHLYTVDIQTGDIRQLTEGDFEVTDVWLSRDGETFILETREASPHQQHLYRMPVAGGERTRLTVDTGGNALLHPSEERAAIRYSTNTEPHEVVIQRFGEDPERVTHSTTDEWEAYAWRTPELVHIPASDGARVPGHLFRPDDPNGAAVFFVHGAGYLQNVHDWWSSYFREYMFHNLLADLGYTVLQLDFRASQGYGRDWRTAIYRHMGGRDLQDYVDASVWVGDEFDIDPERVFIYGGSYGGFITLMALFTEPEHFGGGAALRSVTDWAHYNHGYTSPILNTPLTDSLAYARSSPINFAEGLEDPLLMPHGVVDMNVQYQDIIRLAQRLIELGKTDWELASYPVEPHGFREPSSWTDEYRRILELIESSVGPSTPQRE